MTELCDSENDRHEFAMRGHRGAPGARALPEHQQTPDRPPLPEHMRDPVPIPDDPVPMHPHVGTCEVEQLRADGLGFNRSIDELNEAVRRAAEKPTGLDERVREEQLRANGHILRAYMAHGWHAFPRGDRHLYDYEITDGGDLVVGIVERHTLAIPRGYRVVEAKFIGEDLVFKTEP